LLQVNFLLKPAAYQKTEFQMYKSLVALAILSVASAPVLAQTAPAPAPAPSTTPAKPQMVKKRVCEVTEEDSYSRLGGLKVCRTIEVPATSSGGQNNQQTPAPASPNERG
jgi:hypothetical protein